MIAMKEQVTARIHLRNNIISITVPCEIRFSKFYRNFTAITKKYLTNVTGTHLIHNNKFYCVCQIYQERYYITIP